MNNIYDSSSIEVLVADRDKVTKQPRLYIPDTRLAGCIHLFRECLDNAQDEVMNVGGQVEVTYNEITREYTVFDTGRGIPQGKLREICEVLNSSGKFEKGGKNAYNTAGGQHGLGNKLDNYLSEYYEVTSYRDGKAVTRKYKDGFFIKELIEKSDDHGTYIKFKLSDKYLSETDKVSCSSIMKMIEEKSDACPGFIVKFKGVRKDGSKVKENFTGLTTEELFKKYCKSTSKVWYFDYKHGDTSCRLAFGYNSKAVTTDESAIRGWTNYIYNKEGGTHVDALSDELYEFFRRYMFNRVLSDKDKKDMQIRREDIKLGLCGVVVLLTNEPEFLGQFKEKMISESIKTELMDFLQKEFRKMSEIDLQAISKIIKDNIKARMSSIRARQQVKRVGNGLSKDRIVKYKPPRMGCTTTYNEVYLTEGVSHIVQ